MQRWNFNIFRQTHHRLDGLLSRLPHAETTRVLAQGLGYPGKLLRFALEVILHHRAKQAGREGTVGHIRIQSPRRLAHRVSCPGTLGTISQAAEHRRLTHFVPRFNILALSKSDGQVTGHILHGQQGHRIGQRLGIGTGVTFDSVSQRIHTGSGGDPGRQTIRQFRIEQGQPGPYQRRAAHIKLNLTLIVGDNRPEGNLAAGAGRRRHTDCRRHALFDGLGIGPFVIQNRTAVAGYDPN